MFDWLALRRPAIIAAIARPKASRLPLYAGLAIAAWLAYLLYINTLSLPFFEDDFAHIRWLAQFNSPFPPWVTATGIPAYRPLGEMLLKIWYMILGRHDPVWLRFLNIAMHGLNVALVAALAVRLDRSRYRYWTAGIAAVLFSVLPFAYQAVVWINVFYYPLNDLLQLAMALCYWQARTQGSNRLLVLALFLAFLSPFGIEYGLVNGGLLLAIEAALLLQKRQKAIWLGGPFIALFLNILFLVAWLLVPKSAYEFGPPTAERVMQIATYLLQGITYPVSPLARSLLEQTGLSDLLSIALVGLPALALAVYVIARLRRRAILVVALLWFAFVNLPGLLTLTFDYVINSPRLLYPVGPAMAWLWAAFFTSLAALARRRASRTPLALAAAVALLVVALMNVDFVRIRTDHYHIAENTVEELAAAARETPAGQPLLVVNMVAWLTPPDKTFALGNNGIQWLPFYVGIEDVAYAVDEVDYPIEALQFHNIRQPQPYFYGMSGPVADWQQLKEALLAAGSVYLTQYEPDDITLVPAGRLLDDQQESPAADQPAAIFERGIELALAGYQVQGDQLQLILDWQLAEAIPDDSTVFVHLYGPDGQLVDQDDGYPLRGLAPFWLWDAGQGLSDQRTLAWPAAAQPGSYRIGVGLYDPATGQRVPAVDPTGAPLPDNAAPLLALEWPG
jgi:hypothetical protein